MHRLNPLLLFGVGLTILLIFALLFTSVVPPRDTIRHVYFADNISPGHQAVIDRFNAAHRGRIEVVPVALPFSKFSTNERKELLARSLRNRSDRLDVFSVDLIWVPRFSKWSQRLDDAVSHEERKNILPYALASCSFDSHLVALPLYIDIGLMYYRREPIRRLPGGARLEARLKESITWDEFLALRRRLDLGGAPLYLFQADNFEGLVCNYFELLAGQDRNFFAGNRFNLTSRAAVDGLQLLVDFVHRYGVSPASVCEYDEIRSYVHFLRRGGGFVRGWPNFLENYRSFYPDSVDVDAFGRAALPHFSGREPVSVFGGWNLMLSKYSTNKSAATEFIRYFQGEEAQKIMFELGGFIPTNARVYEDSVYMARHPELVFYRRLLDRGFHRPQLIEYTRMSDIISYYAHLAIKGDLPAREALERAARDMQAENVFHN